MRRLVFIILYVVCLQYFLSAQTMLSLSLEDCQRLALEHNTAIRNADLDFLAAKAQRGEALAEYFPKVSIGAMGFYSLNPYIDLGIQDILGQSKFTEDLQILIDKYGENLGINTRYRTLQRGANVSAMFMQPVYAGGRIVYGNRLAKFGVQAAGFQRELALRNTYESVEENYWMVISLEAKQNTLNHVEEMLDTIYRDVSSAVSAGLASNNDLLQVSLKQNELKSGKIQLENGIRLAKMNLMNSIGVIYNPYERNVNDSIPYIDDIIFNYIITSEAPDSFYVPESELLDKQIEAKLLDLSVAAKRTERRMTLGEALPQVAVGATYGYSYFIEQSKWNGAVGMVVQIPLTDWGKTAKKLQRQDFQIQKAENDRDYLRSQILLQLRQLWLNLSSSWEQLKVTKLSVSTAEDNFSQSQAYYKAGMISVNELLQSQTQLQHTREAYVEQFVAYQSALTKYLNRVN